MAFIRRIPSMLCRLFLLLATLREVVLADESECQRIPDGRSLITSVQVIVQSLHILARYDHDTTVLVNPHFNLTVSNAPTSVDVITTYEKTSTCIRFVETQSTVRRISAPERYFGLIIALSRISQKQRRQVDPLVGNTGLSTSSCAQASVLTILNGQLWSTFTNGTVLQFSATPGQLYAPFVPSQSPGSINDGFSLSNLGTLLWNNAAFPSGNALFCVLSSGQIIAVFQQGANPVGCVFVDLTIYRLTTCQLTDPTNTASPAPIVLQGNQGPLGPTGPRGSPGVAGSIGPSGPSGPSGAQGVPGQPGVTGAVGPSGPSGAQGIQGVPDQSGAVGAVGPSGPSGPPGIQGVSGQPGSTGAIGPSGPSGAQGLQGVPGQSGAAGVAGPSGPSGPQGVQGIPGQPGATGATGAVGPLGPSGPQGVQGIPGQAGPTGVQGVKGDTGAAGPTGPQGPIGPTSGAYGYFGCFYQSGASSSSSGKVLSNFIQAYSTRANVQCSAVCDSAQFNFYGTVSTGTSSDCYCGQIINLISVIGLGNGRAPDNNCVSCPGGPAPAGYCGLLSSNTVAIFAHGF